MPAYSIVIPVYKSTRSLIDIMKQVQDLEKESNDSFEVIFVNDSPDFNATTKTLKKLKNEFKDIKVITLRKSQGQHMALLVGLSKADGNYVITMDDDLQHPVYEIPKLISSMLENQTLDAIFAIPGYRNKKHRFWRNAGSYFIHKVDTLFLENPKNVRKSPFRIITNELKEIILKNHNAMPSVSSLIVNATDNIANIEADHDHRAYGKSNYTIRKLIILTLNNIIHYSSWPLKALGAIGLFGFLFSLVFIFITLARKVLWEITFPGYASTVILISFFGGLNLLAVGIIGEYLIRIIKEQQKWVLDDYIKKLD